VSAPFRSSEPKPFAWSYSRLKNFETCPKRYYHYDVEKDIKEAESYQLSEGNAAHDAFAARIKSSKRLPLGLQQHEPMLARIAAMPGDTYVEQKLALTREFAPVGYFDKTVWFRTVADLCNVHDDTAIVFDWKTGKPSADTTQLQLLSATVMHYMADIERVKAALLFVNHGGAERAEYTRADLPEIWGEILPRVKKLEKAMTEQEYPPTPSGLCKKYCGVTSCPFHGRGSM